jgi:hypothetical protein
MDTIASPQVRTTVVNAVGASWYEDLTTELLDERIALHPSNYPTAA